MRSLAAAVAAVLLAASPAASVDPIRFVDEDAQLTVSFEPLIAEEQWYVAGACEERVGAAATLRVHVSVFRARHTVRIVRNRLNADRIICLDNALAAPKEFWRAYFDR